MSDAVARGLAFLADNQLPTGEWPAFTANDPAYPPGAPWPDRTLFPTAVIVDALQRTPDPGCEPMIERAMAFLQGEREGPGVWRYWTRGHPRRPSIPPDADDTAFVGRLLTGRGISVPHQRELLLALRAPDGRFYTWFAPRWTQRPRSVRFWRAAAYFWRAPLAGYRFWKVTPSRRSDIDVVVNVNVLRRLGDEPGTAAVAPFVARVLERDEETTADKWYREPCMLHYVVAHAVREGCASLAPLRDESSRRLLARQAEDGSWADGSPLATALAATALRTWGHEDPAVERAQVWLRARQGPDGAWPIDRLCYGGPGTDIWWGSAEATTALALEALAG